MKVYKFGGASVRNAEGVRNLRNIIDDEQNLFIIVSAMGKTTNQLIAMANQISDRVNKRELDSLLSTGEQRTVTLLAMAIDALGIPAISLTGYQCGFITSHHHAHARIKDINIDNLKRHLDEGKVVVVAGFQGATENGEITTDQIQTLIRERKVFPCYFGSALKLEGVQELLDGLEKYMD